MENPRQQLDIELIKKRAIAGVVTFTLRTFFIQGFTFAATFILTVLLAPEILGIFFVVSAIINFFIYFSDVGLAAALIQKKENLKRSDMVSTFTIQQIIVFSLVSLGLIFSSQIASFYKLDDSGLLLLRVVIFSLLFSSLKTIPSIILERKLDFTRLVIPQITENITFYTIAVYFAHLGYGLNSFTWAVLARGIVGLVLIYILSPWRPGFGIDIKSAKKLTSFGIPFQLNSVLALAKDDLLTIFLGKILTFTEVGFIGWAQKWSFTPLRFFMDNVNKVTFPAYSRLQSHTNQLSGAIEKSLFFVTFLVYPSIFGLLAVAPKIIEIVPNYGKWEPALPLLYLFSVNAIFSAVSTTFTNTLFALGHPKVILKLMIFWTSATWVLTYPLIVMFGYTGVAIASAIIASTSVITIYFVKKEVKVSVAKNILGPFVISVLMYLILVSLINTFITNIPGLFFIIIIGIVIYFIMSFALFKNKLLTDAKIIINSIINK